MLSILNYLIFRGLRSPYWSYWKSWANGEAISLFSPDETVFYVISSNRYEITNENIAGFEPDPNASTAPIKQGQVEQRTSAPRKPKTDTTSSNNSFGPRRPNANNIDVH
jgi:ATP-dependent RNA helicase RhlE